MTAPQPSDRRSFSKMIFMGAGGVLAAPQGLPVSVSAQEGSAPKAKQAVVTHQDTFALLQRPGGKIPVIFDTDIGSDIDDTWALLYLLKCPELDVKLVATDSGQGDYRAALTAKFLDAVGRTDIPIARSVGNRGGLGNQQDWIKDFKTERYEGVIHPDSATAIIETIHASDVPVTVVCVGTVPNIAEALRRDPTICQNARFVGMHGSIYRGYGGSSKPVAESNVRHGVEALRKTFAADWQCSITPLDTCGVLHLEADRYQSVLRSGAVGIDALMENYRVWLQRVPWLKTKPDPMKKSTTLFDMVAVTMAFSESWLKMETLPLTISDEGFTEVSPTDKSARDIRCAIDWQDYASYQDHLVERLTS